MQYQHLVPALGLGKMLTGGIGHNPHPVVGHLC